MTTQKMSELEEAINYMTKLMPYARDLDKKHYELVINLSKRSQEIERVAGRMAQGLDACNVLFEQGSNEVLTDMMIAEIKATLKEWERVKK